MSEDIASTGMARAGLAGNGGHRGTGFLTRADTTTVRNGDGVPKYFGAKTGAGVWQTIINEIPPHERFIEAFAGMASITRRKRPAASTILIESDAAACGYLRASFGDGAGVSVICGDAISWLERNRAQLNGGTVVYCDPPYPFAVRSGGRHRYRCEGGEEWWHRELLELLAGLEDVPILLSGYRCDLYDQALASWRRVDYTAQTRGGPKIESLWCNFRAAGLAEYTVAGRDFRERERLRRKRQRWIFRLETMAALDREVLLAAIDEWRSSLD